jgi:ribosomal protein S21
VFNGNLEQALLALKKQTQRDHTLVKLRANAYFVPSNVRRKLKQKEISKRYSRKKAMMANSEN